MKEPSWPKLRGELAYNSVKPDADGMYSLDDLRCFASFTTSADFQHIVIDAAINSLRADGLLRS